MAYQLRWTELEKKEKFWRKVRGSNMSKKIMLLGGSRYALPVIDAAHKLDCQVITCDYLPDNIAHKYSDQYVNVSIVEKDAVLQVARSFGIDGIMSFGCDPGVTTAAYVAEKMNLPSVGSYRAVSILQNKGRFRKFLADNGFHVPMAKQYKNKHEALKETDLFHWPVIVKPTDSAGSKGVSRVDDISKLSAAIDYAVEKSVGKEFIIEDFLEKVGCSSDSDCFSIDGEIKFISFNAQWFDAAATNPYVPAAFSWPSTLTKEHQEELISEIQRLINLLHLKSSIFNIEVRECTDGKAYIMECSPRGGGNRLAEMIKYATGVDMIQGAVLAAVGKNITDIVQKPVNGYWAEVILHSDQSGIFDNLWIKDEIRANVIERSLWVNRGDYVESFTAANNTIGTLVLRFDTEESMLNVMENIKKYVKVITV